MSLINVPAKSCWRDKLLDKFKVRTPLSSTLDHYHYYLFSAPWSLPDRQGWHCYCSGKRTLQMKSQLWPWRVHKTAKGLFHSEQLIYGRGETIATTHPLSEVLKCLEEIHTGQNKPTQIYAFIFFLLLLQNEVSKRPAPCCIPPRFMQLSHAVAKKHSSFHAADLLTCSIPGQWMKLSKRLAG